MENAELLIEQWGTPTYNKDAEHHTLVESFDDKVTGNLYIQGVFLQANVINRNKRVYPKKVLEKAVDKYIREQVETKQALGELNHPTSATPDPRNCCIIIEKMWWEGDNVIGKARVIEGDHGDGDKLASLIRAGWIPAVSSRGLGRTKDSGAGYKIVQEGYVLTVGVDVVWGPSAPNAYVQPVVESISEDHTKPETECQGSDHQKTENILESNNKTFKALTEALIKTL